MRAVFLLVGFFFVVVEVCVGAVDGTGGVGFGVDIGEAEAGCDVEGVASRIREGLACDIVLDDFQLLFAGRPVFEVEQDREFIAAEAGHAAVLVLDVTLQRFGDADEDAVAGIVSVRSARGAAISRRRSTHSPAYTNASASTTKSSLSRIRVPSLDLPAGKRN